MAKILQTPKLTKKAEREIPQDPDAVSHEDVYAQRKGKGGTIIVRLEALNELHVHNHNLMNQELSADYDN
jgi:hypothetical protein